VQPEEGGKRAVKAVDAGAVLVGLLAVVVWSWTFLWSLRFGARLHEVGSIERPSATHRQTRPLRSPESGERIFL